jgi:hypothetical protein
MHGLLEGVSRYRLVRLEVLREWGVRNEELPTAGPRVPRNENKKFYLVGCADDSRV